MVYHDSDVRKQEVTRAVDYLYLKGDVSPFYKIFGVREEEEEDMDGLEDIKREPVIIPFTRHPSSRDLDDLGPKDEIIVKEEVDEESYDDVENSFEEESINSNLLNNNGNNAGVDEDLKTKARATKAVENSIFGQFKCTECVYIAKSKALLRDHWRYKHNDNAKLFDCKECEYKTKRRADLKKHLVNIHKISDAESQYFLEDEALPSKIVGEEVEGADGRKVMYFNCPDCEFKTKRRNVLATHIDDRHINPFQHVCDTCGKSFAEKKLLSEHVKRIHLDEKVSCDICGLRDSNVHLIRIHKKLKHEGFVQPCPYCDKIYTEKSGCRSHIRKYHPGLPVSLPPLVRREERAYTYRPTPSHSEVFQGSCIFEDCGQEFRTRRLLVLHQEETHGTTRLRCQQCEFEGDKFQLRIHIKRQHRNKSEGYFCDQCGFSCKGKSHLNEHIESVHEGIRYPCDSCDFVAVNKVTLRHHRTKKHKNKSFSCHICGYNTAQHHSLIKHIQTKH